MARVREFKEEAGATPAPTVTPAPEPPWPFATGADNAKVPPPKAPATEAPEPVVAEPVKASAQKPAPSAPPPSAKPVVEKASDSVEALVLKDLRDAVEGFAEADKKHRAVALEAVEARVKIVKAVLGISD